MLNPTPNRHMAGDMGPLALPPRDIQLTDFNYILRQWRADLFVSERENSGVLLFKPTESLPRWQGGPSDEYKLAHNVFLFRGDFAAQLHSRSAVSADSPRFSLACHASSVPEGIVIERKGAKCVVRDPHGRVPQKEYMLRAPNLRPPASILLYPLPAYPRVLLHSESLGFICFAFDHVGAYPKMCNTPQETVEVRGFYGAAQRWLEFNVHSTRMTGGGFRNLFFETELGRFFVPGIRGSERATHVDKTQKTVEITTFDIDEQKEPRSPHFSLDAHKALRSLGLPAIWPPEELLP